MTPTNELYWAFVVVFALLSLLLAGILTRWATEERSDMDKAALKQAATHSAANDNQTIQ